MKKQPIKRLSFDLVEFLKALEGWQGSEWAIVIPRDAYRKILGEVERLQAVEQAAIDVHALLTQDQYAVPAPHHPAMRLIADCYRSEVATDEDVR